VSSGTAAPGRPHDWLAEYTTLSERARQSALSCAELERLAVAAFLIGRDDEVTPLRESAIERYLAEGAVDRAFRCAFWLGFHLENAGQHARAAGWLAKLERLIEPDPALLESLGGLLVLARAAGLMMTGRFAEALPMFEVGREDAVRRGDVDATVLAGSGAAACTEMLGRPQDAIVLLDEVMVDVVARPVAPQVVGLVYCSMIALCIKYLDIGRAREWTRALARWCDDQSGMVPYRGACTVHRAELLQFEGSWPQAEAIAQAASRPPADPAVAGLAHYRLAEILRLRGRLEAAEDEYRAAVRNGCEVQPGLALLRAAQGRLAAAQSALDRVGHGAGRAPARPGVIAALIEIALLRGDLKTAEQAVDELAGLADAPGAATWLKALAAHGGGALLLAQGRPGQALGDLRRAASMWSGLDAPYQAARTRVLIADACDALGDLDTAVLERDTAREVFDELGAATDVRAIDAGRATLAGLSPREIEVLRVLATGATNRAIAERLVLSEKTVARHLSNIFGKLGINSRSAAVVYAFEHGLA